MKCLSSSKNPEDAIAEDFDGRACEFCDRYKRKGLSPSSSLLLRFIEDEGLQDKSVLDLGCGAGTFTATTLQRGAQSAVGIDLSPKMIDVAQELAKTERLETKAKFEVGNAATADLSPSDMVVMDKVICCYPQFDTLLKNAAGACRSIIGFVVPRDDGLLKGPLRLGKYIINFFERRRGGIQFYLHPLDAVDRTLRDAGFVQLRKKGSRLWLVFLYKRATLISNSPIRESLSAASDLVNSQS